MLAQQAIAQLVRLFGEQAAQPLWQGVQDWATEPATATALYVRYALPALWLALLLLGGALLAPGLRRLRPTPALGNGCAA